MHTASTVITFSKVVGHTHGETAHLWTEGPRVFMEVPFSGTTASGVTFRTLSVKEITPTTELPG